MELGLRNRVAIVTGSSQGIGKAVAYGLAREGAKIVLCARNENALQITTTEIASSTRTDVLSVPTDLRNKEEIESLVKSSIKRFGRIDILVNNAGGPPPMLFVETSEDSWQEAVNLLLMSVINCCNEVIPHMKQSKWGRIINMTSFAAKQPAERLILSNAVRAGVLGLTKTLSNELAEYSILVNAVCPGWTLTKRTDDLAKSTAEKTGKNKEAIITEWANNIPLKRFAEPEEIANLVVFLASEKASYITGAVLQIDGGFIKSLL